jgi:aspartokinase-like uncharacterized kinase
LEGGVVADLTVIKLGGSLLDLDDLIQRLAVVRANRVAGAAVMIVGGAEAADVVRRFDRLYQLGERAGHWLAVRAMQFNAHVVAAAVGDSAMAGDENECGAAWRDGLLAVIDPLQWLQRDEMRGVAVPHRWTFTSDSIAAHLASRLEATRLLMLKSRLLDRSDTVDDGVETNANGSGERDAGRVQLAAAWGLVDADFPEASRHLPSIEVINLRHASLAAGRVDAAARIVLR